MTMSPGGPPDPRQQQQWQQGQPYGDYPPPGGGKKALPWLLGGAVVVVAALVVTLVLVLGGDDDDKGGLAGTGDYDLSSPSAAAESFAAAAATKDGEALLALTCFASDPCNEKYGSGVSQSRIDKVKKDIVDGVGMLAEQLEGAEFEEPGPASGPIKEATEVRYHTPDMGSHEFRALMFVELDGKWLYFGSAGGGDQSGPPRPEKESETESESETSTTCIDGPTTGPFQGPCAR